MHVDVTEIFPDGRVSVRPGVDLAAAVPDREKRNRVMSILARGEIAALQDGPASVTITLTRNRPPPNGTVFAVRIRPKSGPSGAMAPRLNDYGAMAPRPSPGRQAAPPAASTPRIVDRIAAVMRRQATETGACTMLDLRQAGLSYRQVIKNADAAREALTAAELQPA